MVASRGFVNIVLRDREQSSSIHGTVQCLERVPARTIESFLCNTCIRPPLEKSARTYYTLELGDR